MTYYKGMNRNMINYDIEFQVGQTYYYDGELMLCSKGFHFCSNLLDCFFYHPRREKSRYFEVEVGGDVIEAERKSVCSEITIIRELSDIEVNHWAYGSGSGNGGSLYNRSGSGGRYYSGVGCGFWTGYYSVDGNSRGAPNPNGYLIFDRRPAITAIRFLGNYSKFIHDFDEIDPIEIDGVSITPQKGDSVIFKSSMTLFTKNRDAVYDGKYWLQMYINEGQGDGYLGTRNGSGGSGGSKLGYSPNIDGVGENIQEVAIFNWLIIDDLETSEEGE